MRKKALLIGVGTHENSHDIANLVTPKRDVRALRAILEAATIGDFDQVDEGIDLEASQMQEAIELFFQDCQRDDLLLFYFSGHGLRDDQGKLYLATKRTKRNQQGGLLRSSTVSADFIHEAVAHSPAKRKVLILDCCFSGAYRHSLTAKGAAIGADVGAIELTKFLGAEGGVVLASSSSIQYSFEHKTDGLSIYTKYLIEGLKSGQADLDRDGHIAVRELHEYVASQVQAELPDVVPKIIVLSEDGYNIAIAQSNYGQANYGQANYGQANYGQANYGQANYGQAHHRQEGPKHLETDLDFWGGRSVRLAEAPQELGAWTYSALPNSLQTYEALLRQLVDGLDQLHWAPDSPGGRAEAELRRCVLDFIQAQCQAEFVCVYQYESQAVRMSACSDLANRGALECLMADILPEVAYSDIFSSDHNGIYRAAGGNLFLMIPLKVLPTPEFLTLCVPAKGFAYLADAFAVILSTFYQLPRDLLQVPDRAEATLLDTLKKTFGFLSPELYRRRFALFQARLQTMTVYFQPIVQLDTIDIVAWEALARDPATKQAPVDLFEAAQLWGTQFTTELDLYFLNLATQLYRNERKRLKLNRAAEVTPIAINVYPASLLRSVYFEAVRKIMQTDGLIPPGKLILEISEKSALPQSPHWDNDKPEWHGFKNQLKEFIRQNIKVRFAIDDFGVGYASLSRLLGLNLDYVKIDREVLYHENEEVAGRTFKYVSDILIEAEHYGSTVIVEGVDATCPVSLAELKSKGVSSIQGFLVDPAVDHIYPRLSSDQVEVLRSRL
jgi:EAL domain-containing protein (putative c-di-GMP-specific phosphodiesterase class I)/uncharacterized caspase-like protein